MAGPPLWLDAEAVRAACSPLEAVEAVTAALRGGLDPGRDPARTAVPVAGGSLLLMPAELPAGPVGVKVLTLGGPGHDPSLPLVQGVYLLFDGGSLAPVAVLDGAALTTLRTPAVSVAGVRERLQGLARPYVVVLGAGPQGTGHVATLRAVLPGGLGPVRYVVRDPPRARPPLTDDTAVLRAGSADAAAALAAADVVVCATGAGTPVFDSAGLRDDTVVVAVGSHDPGRRELDAALLRRAVVVVEDVPTALREAGDVVLAVADGALFPADLVPLRDVVTGVRPLPADRPVVLKTVGMAWQDLVVAGAVLSGAQRTSR